MGSKDIKKIIISSVLMSVMLPSISSAQIDTGNRLYQYCTSDDQAYLLGCIIFLNTIRETVDLVDVVLQQRGSQGPTKPFCIPQDVSGGQMLDLVATYLRDNPETRQHDAIVLTMTAMLQAWPCN